MVELESELAGIHQTSLLDSIHGSRAIWYADTERERRMERERERGGGGRDGEMTTRQHGDS